MLGGLDFHSIAVAVRRALQPVIGTIGANGSVLLADSTQSAGARWGVPPLRMYLSGLTYGPGDGAGAGDLINDVTIFAGVATDSTGAEAITLAAASITKQLDAAWAVGSAAGGLDTGVIGNSDYYIHLIKRPDTGVVDALFSLSATAPTMPSGYTYRRLIGWFKRVGGTIVAFHTYETEGGGIHLSWDAPTLDVNLANTLTTARRTDAVKVPLNFSVRALLRAHMFDAAAAFLAIVCNPNEADAVPGAGAAPSTNMSQPTAGLRVFADLNIVTSATGTVAARANLATVDQYDIVTLGFFWARRN